MRRIRGEHASKEVSFTNPIQPSLGSYQSWTSTAPPDTTSLISFDNVEIFSPQSGRPAESAPTSYLSRPGPPFAQPKRFGRCRLSSPRPTFSQYHVHSRSLSQPTPTPPLPPSSLSLSFSLPSATMPLSFILPTLIDAFVERLSSPPTPSSSSPYHLQSTPTVYPARYPTLFHPKAVEAATSSACTWTTSCVLHWAAKLASNLVPCMNFFLGLLVCAYLIDER